MGLGNDTDYTDSGDDKVYGGAGDHSLISNGSGLHRFYGCEGNDVLAVGASWSTDYFDGGAGDDTLLGHENADTLIGNDLPLCGDGCRHDAWRQWHRHPLCGAGLWFGSLKGGRRFIPDSGFWLRQYGGRREEC
ncbi:MAG: hypothetical protein JJ959_06475 [Nisaea sp.]|nr:hypothetical protein [Nisaea sp.]